MEAKPQIPRRGPPHQRLVESRSLNQRWRFTAPPVIAILVGLIAWASYQIPSPGISDFDQLHLAARALLKGADPYAAVVSAGYPFPLFYPLPAVLLAVPFTPLPIDLARAAWSGLGAGCLTAAALRYRRALPVALLGAGFGSAVVLGQWSPIATAAAVFPWLSVAWIAKPTIGAALFVAYPTRRAALLCSIFLALSVAVWPSWPASWYHALQSSFQTAPVLQPGGFLLLLALLRWRRPEGRLLAALACAPQSIQLYETVPLFLIPRTRWEGYALAASSLLAAFLQAWIFPPRLSESLAHNLSARWPILLLLIYLPALALVLRLPKSDNAIESTGVPSPSA